MTPTATTNVHVLARHEGPVLLTAQQALVKGVLEADWPVELILCPRSEPFGAVLQAAREPGAADVMQQHDLRVQPVPHASRAVDLAADAARSGAASVALTPAEQLATAEAAIERASNAGRSEADGGGSMCIVIEDDPHRSRGLCPRELTRFLDLPCLEASSIDDLRELIDEALRLARSATGIACLIAHRDIWRMADTVHIRPNRVGDSIDATIARRYRRSRRTGESNDVLRLARRLELNRLHRLPSPGEREAVGFVLAGPAVGAMHQLLHVLHMTGRVPLLHLRLVHPIDESVVQRLLSRCERVVVLEARRGSIESQIMAIAEAMRGDDQQPAMICRTETINELGGSDSHAMSPLRESVGHPSILARRLQPMLALVRPIERIESCLTSLPSLTGVTPTPRQAGIGYRAAAAQLIDLLRDVQQWLADRPAADDEANRSTWIGLVGEAVPVDAERIVRAEIWPAGRLLSDGWSAVRHAAGQSNAHLLLVCAVDEENEIELERFSRGLIPADAPRTVRIVTAEFAQRQRLREQLREAAMDPAVTIMIIRDGSPAQYDVQRVERELSEPDRLGFEPRQRLIWSVDQTCTIRLPDDEQLLERAQQRDPGLMEPQFSIDRLPIGVEQRFKLRIRPMFEQVDVIRTRPPLAAWRQQRGERLPAPVPIHADRSVWRMHVAGYRGGPTGVYWRVLCRAGRHMGYLVRTLTDATPIGAGRRAWMQVLFTRPARSEFVTSEQPHIPFGEADLLIGLDWDETLRAIGADPELRVAHPSRTSAVINSGFFEDERETNRIRLHRQQQRSMVEQALAAESSRVEDFADAARLTFHTDRVTDLVMLGLAFQRGLVPLSLDALETALQELEAVGYGRAREAFEYGRHLALQRRLLSRPRIDAVGDIDRLYRRLLLTVRRSGPGGRRRAKRFRQLLERTLTLTPGLAETDAGRLVRRDMMLGLYRSMLWGGLAYAGRYADLIIQLYEADRGETGRAVTRYMVLPLADAMLIRDALYIATLASSPEQRRRIRQRLMVKFARGDELERRYLTRLEMTALRRRIRADVRTSDWPARVIAVTRHVAPPRWRGTAGDRKLREQMIELVGRMARNLRNDYEHWLAVARGLHERSAQNQLRRTTDDSLLTWSDTFEPHQPDALTDDPVSSVP